MQATGDPGTKPDTKAPAAIKAQAAKVANGVRLLASFGVSMLWLAWLNEDITSEGTTTTASVIIQLVAVLVVLLILGTWAFCAFKLQHNDQRIIPALSREVPFALLIIVVAQRFPRKTTNDDIAFCGAMYVIILMLAVMVEVLRSQHSLSEWCSRAAKRVKTRNAMGR